MDISRTGLLSIYLSGKVRFPSYMKQEVKQNSEQLKQLESKK